MTMKRKYDGLWLTVLDDVKHLQTCGYWYVVTSHATAHTAFATERGLRRWLDERDLTLGQPLTAPGIWSSQPVFGEYFDEAHMNQETFDALKPIVETRDLSNGDYVECRITEDENLCRTTHTLNPNVKGRKVFDYHESREMMK